MHPIIFCIISKFWKTQDPFCFLQFCFPYIPSILFLGDSYVEGQGATAWINKFIINLDGTTKLEGPAYFYFFAFMMLLSAIGFIFVERFYKSRTYFKKELAISSFLILLRFIECNLIFFIDTLWIIVWSFSKWRD